MPLSTDAPATPATAAPAGPETLLRIEKGNPDACELAALTSVLLARAAACAESDDDVQQAGRPTAGWRRLERRSGPGTPRSWRDDMRR